MREYSGLVILLLAACGAPETAPPVAATPVAGPVIFTPAAIAPRLLPGTTPSNPAQQNLDRSIRLDSAINAPGAPDANRALRSAEPGSFSSGVGAEAQLPDEPTDRARVFQRR